MKKRVFALALVFAMLCVALPLTASADSISGDSAHMDVSYEVEAPAPPASEPDGEGDPPPAPRSYIVEIPASINLKYMSDFFIHARYADIREGEKMVVSIDGARTFPDGPFYMYRWDGPDPVPQIECTINRGWQTNMAAGFEALTGPGDAEIAVFGPSSVIDSSAPIEAYGWLQFVPNYTTDTTPGVYTGIVYFKIGIVGE